VREDLEQPPGLDLSGTDLAWANFWEADLKRAGFYGARLEGADFGGACLQKVEFNKAQMNCVRLQNASLQNAHLERAHDLTPDQVLDACKKGCDAWLPEAWTDAAREKVWEQWPDGVAVWKPQWEKLFRPAAPAVQAEAQPAADQIPAATSDEAAAAPDQHPAPASLVAPAGANGAVTPAHEPTQREIPPTSG
jgi:hypothetical protein